ncbi:MAG TPA: tRNA (adenosine(37)-N6)-threonylcarbamoyltransferase complex dimerization subunit type 1 TsaB [Candidatus Hydrogenedentes bacterium]|nr:tRNA (adenosine(37)-N6)-threonylcarbamoyltransferase complex dimerization subunit type 1 TsaB [Candidatus Hydrogenedentota bacterium]
MKILAVDTCTAFNAVALCEDAAVLAETTVLCGRAHSERLIPTVNWLLAETGLCLADVDLLAVTIGPGSFTGVRIGVATWKGLALAARKPLVGVPTLDAMSLLAAVSDGIVCPLLDARMREVYGAVYAFDGGVRRKCSPDRVGPVEAIMADFPDAPILLGDGAAMYRDRILALRPRARIVPPMHLNPRAAAVAQEAFHLVQSGMDTDPSHVSPVYLRQSQAEENRARRSRPDVPVL